MKKHLTFILAALVITLGLTACGGNKQNKEVTVSAPDLAKQLAEETVTTDPLANISADILASTYFVDMTQVEESAAYLNTGATGCEVTVIKCKEESYTSEVTDLLKARIKSQSELYATYDTVAAKKIDSAIIKTSGKYIVLCISDDYGKAESILKEAGF